MINRIKNLIFGSLKRELMIVVIISIIIIFSALSWGINEANKIGNPINDMISDANELFVGVTRFVTRNDEGCREYLNNLAEDYKYNLAITDLKGNIILKSSEVNETSIDWERPFSYEKSHLFYQIYDVRVSNNDMRLFVWKTYDIESNNFIGFTVMASIIFVLGFVYYFINRKVNYIKNIADNIRNLSEDSLDNIIEEQGRDELEFVAKQINLMTRSLKEKIDRDKKRENLKNELITNVSHDLRTPLTSLMGYLNLIDDEKTTEENKKKYIKISLEKSQRLKVLLEDLFEYSKLESKEIILDKREINIIEIIDQCIGEHELEAKNKEMKFIKEYYCNKLLLNVDANKIARAFENIIVNAIKYGDNLTDIVIRISKTNDELNIIFENKVQGSKVSDINRIFDRFYRGDESRNSKVSGSGLGLAIVKSIIELHNGDVKVELNNDTIKIIVSLKNEIDL